MADTDKSKVPTKRLPKAEEADFLADMAVPVETKVKYHYQYGQGSLQDIARVYQRYGLTMDDVLNITGNSDISTVTTEGDQIDADYAGPGAAMNYGQTFKTPVDLT